MATKVYVQFYNYFWSMNPEQFVKFCEFGMEHGYADAKDFGKMLQGVPRCSTTNDHLHYTPLDWDRGDFAEARNKVRELCKLV